jgi:predicted small metal-binding protein
MTMVRQSLQIRVGIPGLKGSPKGGAMAKVIKCVCGYVMRGETDEELLAKAEDHIRTMHLELVGKFSRDDLMAMADLDPSAMASGSSAERRVRQAFPTVATRITSLSPALPGGSRGGGHGHG